jgi:hypothetical protein
MMSFDHNRRNKRFGKLADARGQFTVAPTDCEHLSGFSKTVLEDAAKRLRHDVHDVFSTAVMLHLNTPWDQLEIVVRSSLRFKEMKEEWKKVEASLNWSVDDLTENHWLPFRIACTEAIRAAKKTKGPWDPAQWPPQEEVADVIAK